MGGLGLATTDLVNARALLTRSRKTLDVSIWQDLREADQMPVVDEEPLSPPPPEPAPPRLTPTGHEPAQPQETSHV